MQCITNSEFAVSCPYSPSIFGMVSRNLDSKEVGRCGINSMSMSDRPRHSGSSLPFEDVAASRISDAMLLRSIVSDRNGRICKSALARRFGDAMDLATDAAISK